MVSLGFYLKYNSDSDDASDIGDSRLVFVHVWVQLFLRSCDMAVHPRGGECQTDALADGGPLGNFLHAGLFVSSANRFSASLKPYSLIFVLLCLLAGFNGDKLEDND